MDMYTSTFEQVSFGGLLGPNRFQWVTCEVGAGRGFGFAFVAG